MPHESRPRYGAYYSQRLLGLRAPGSAAFALESAKVILSSVPFYWP
jgi:hypothetical protein